MIGSGPNPSYAQGYAHYAGESANPGLWRGQRGLWVPALGPTGLMLRDVSGFGNHGTLTNMAPATAWVMTPHGWALDFDGADDYIQLPFASISIPLSLVAVVKTDVKDDNHRQIFSNYNATADDLFLKQDRTGLTGQYVFKHDAGDSVVGGTVTVGVWTHLVATLDGTNITLYQDGVQVGQVADAVTTTVNNGSNFRIGRTPADSEPYDGRIAQVLLYDRALPASEIQRLYTDPFAALRWERRVFPAAAPPSGAISGNTAITFTASGAIAGAGSLAGSSSLAFTPAGAVAAKGSLAGSAAASFTPAGAIAGTGSLAGSTSIGFTPAGDVKSAGSLAGSTSVGFTPSGAIAGAGALLGSDGVAFAASGKLLDLSGAIAGAAAATFLASGRLRKLALGPYRVAAGQFASPGAVAGQVSKSGAVAGQVSKSGAVAGQVT